MLQTSRQYIIQHVARLIEGCRDRYQDDQDKEKINKLHLSESGESGEVVFLVFCCLNFFLSS